MKALGDIDRCLIQITKGFDDKQVRSIRAPSILIDEFEGFLNVVFTVRIRAFPATLLQLDLERVAILENRVRNRSDFYATGMHTITALRAEGARWPRLYGERFRLPFDLDVRNGNVWIF